MYNFNKNALGEIINLKNKVDLVSYLGSRLIVKLILADI